MTRPEASSSEQHPEREEQPEPSGGSDVQSGEKGQTGKRTRNKLARLLGEDVELSGSTDLMVSNAGAFAHRVVMRGRQFTTEGGNDVVVRVDLYDRG